MNWVKYSEQHPENGQTVIIKHGDYTSVATYCENEFFQLLYDKHLGVLRKYPIHGLVTEWKEIL